MSDADAMTLSMQLNLRHNSLSDSLPKQRPNSARPYIPTRHTLSSNTPHLPFQPPSLKTNSQLPGLQRRRSFSAVISSYPSRGERLIFSVFPSPQSQPAASQRASRPSSAVILRAGRIPFLRESKPWV